MSTDDTVELSFCGVAPHAFTSSSFPMIDSGTVYKHNRQRPNSILLLITAPVL